MGDRPSRPGIVVAGLVVGYLGLVVAGSYVGGSAVIEAMRAQQTADVLAALPLQEDAAFTVAQEQTLAGIMEIGCAAEIPDCPSAAQARAALLDLGSRSAVQQTTAVLDRRDQALTALDDSMLDPEVRDAIAATRADRAAVEEVHRTIGEAPGPAVEAYDRYLQGASGLSASLAAASDDELRSRIQAQQLLGELALAVFLERPVVGLALGGGAVDGTPGTERAAAHVAAVDAQVAAAQEAIDRAGSGEQVPPFDVGAAAARAAVRTGEPAALTPAQAQEQSRAYLMGSVAWLESVPEVRDALRAATIDLAQDRATGQTNRALVTWGVVAVVLLAGLVAVIVVSVLVFRRPTAPPAHLPAPGTSSEQP